MRKKVQLLVAILFCFTAIAHAQFKKLHDMSTGQPNGSLTIVGNVMYGTASAGGANGFGYLFSISRNGTNFKDIFDFDDTGSVANKCNGKNPNGNLTYVNGKLYGFTNYGGLHSDGTIFSINTNGSGYEDLWDFTSSSGKWPYQGLLTLCGKKFFGTTNLGGAANFGVIFSIDTNGNNYTDLYDFLDTGTVVGRYDGQYPSTSTFSVINGRLYGMTTNGGAYGYGEIYAIDTNGKDYMDLLDFDNINYGASPQGALLLSGHKFYGMTSLGNSGYSSYGSIFSIDTNGTAYQTLANLASTNGATPNGDLAISPKGKLYGMTYAGGTSGYGVLFSMDTNGQGYKVLASFTGTANGSFPEGNVTVERDTLFGITQKGGTSNVGAIFEYIDTSMVAGLGNISSVASSAFYLYPNPNSGEFIVKGEMLKVNSIIEVYNILGAKIYSNELSTFNSQLSIDLSNNASGIYLYRIITNNGELIKEGKLVIEK